MASKTIKICDQCGKEVILEANQGGFEAGFASIDIQFASGYQLTSVYSHWSGAKVYELCEDCLNKIGITRREGIVKPVQENISDRLYEIASEIVADIMSRDTN